MATRLLLSAAVAGAISMFFLDPDHGRRRRALMRERVAGGISRIDDATRVASRDLQNRARGLAHEFRARLTPEDVPDEILAERVRARLGAAVSHPGAIEVAALAGRVTLSGAVLEREYVRLLRLMWTVRGVVDIEDRLAVYESAAGVSALQGGGKLREPRFGPWQQNWPPGVRMVMGAVGSVLVLNALVGRRSGLGFLGGVGGLALIARSGANMPIDRLVGVRRPSMDLQKCIEVAAPIEQVFETFSQLERFPEFMKHVREVHVRGDGTSQWVVEGPAGGTVSWEAVTTRLEPNRLIAWRTLPGSAVDHAGLLRFEPTEGGTRIFVTMSYTPPAGALGHAVARLFGTDPKSELDDDLMRMKVFLETGRRARDAAAARH
ncbi:MAG TPA: SRPBCC family protein [Steroidobacteraceae bacterium]|nr:SRPBCC family protein [Steroidobacteraceae bacterium]